MKNHRKRKCKTYYNAKQNLRDIKRRMERNRKKFLVKIVKSTLRNILSRILGCRFLRSTSISKHVRIAMKKIRSKVISPQNVTKYTDFFKSMVNHRTKKKLIKKTKKVMKKILSNFLRRKKIDAKTRLLFNKLIKKNCRMSRICFVRKIFSRKCYMYSKSCIKLRSLKKTSKIARTGVVLTKLIKNILSL